MKQQRYKAALMAALAASSLMLVGCKGTEDAGAAVTSDGRISYLNYGDFGGGAAPKANYNPYLDATKLAATEYLYERLYITEGYSCRKIPWLATAYHWTDPKTLVFTIRHGVTWNDGKPFTAKDVAFTFNLLHKHSALDTQGVWTSLKSVTATAGDQVTFSFKEPGASAFPTVTAVQIVPEHIWSKVKDPTTFTNTKDPVGTGPMMVKSFNPQELVVRRNPSYWQANKVKVQQIRFHKADAGGQVEQLKLSRGEYDQNAMFVPDIQKSYVDRDPKHHHYWYAPGGVIAIYMNLTKAPFDDVAFRRALLPAFDHNAVVNKAELGYVHQASQTGLVIPGQEAWLPNGVKNQGREPYDPKAADQALTAAGYKKNAQGQRLDKQGNPIHFTFKVPGSYTDWVAAADILVKNLRQLGMTVDMETPTPEVHDQDRNTGNYDMMFGVFGGTCDMYRNFDDPLDSARTAPVGKPALSNETRWQDPATDRLLGKLKVAASPAAQKKDVQGLANIMLNKVPSIPIWYGAKWFQYDTSHAVGWPNAQHPYSAGGDNLVVLTHLRPAPQGD
ncbi:MAG: ABC transporter substrate-binding protein [Nocardioidaceae bacterium]